MNVAEYIGKEVQYRADGIGKLTLARMAAHEAGIEEEQGFVALPAGQDDAYEFHIFSLDLGEDYYRLLPLVRKFEKQKEDAPEGYVFVGTMGVSGKLKIYLHASWLQKELARAWPEEGQLIAVEAAAGV